MLFTDELTATGRKANPKNNLSMMTQLKAMQDACNDRVRKATPAEKQWTITNSLSCLAHAITTLYKEGYPFYNPDKIKIGVDSGTIKVLI